MLGGSLAPLQNVVREPVQTLRQAGAADSTCCLHGPLQTHTSRHTPGQSAHIHTYTLYLFLLFPPLFLRNIKQSRDELQKIMLNNVHKRLHSQGFTPKHSCCSIYYFFKLNCVEIGSRSQLWTMFHLIFTAYGGCILLHGSIYELLWYFNSTLGGQINQINK